MPYVRILEDRQQQTPSQDHQPRCSSNRRLGNLQLATAPLHVHALRQEQQPIPKQGDQSVLATGVGPQAQRVETRRPSSHRPGQCAQLGPVRRVSRPRVVLLLDQGLQPEVPGEGGQHPEDGAAAGAGQPGLVTVLVCSCRNIETLLEQS